MTNPFLARKGLISLGTSSFSTDIEMSGSFLFDTTQIPTTSRIGQISWNQSMGTLDVHTDVPDVVIQVGQETLVRVRNSTDSTIPNGTAVYVSGSQGNRPTVFPAVASDYLSSNRLIGLATSDIAKNTDSYVTIVGVVNDLDTHTFTEGDFLFLSDTIPGSYTVTPPTDPTHVAISVGLVLRSHINKGAILVDVRQRALLVGEQISIRDLSNGVVTASLYGTASWSTNTLTASYVQPSTTFSLTSVTSTETVLNVTKSLIVPADAGLSSFESGTPLFTLMNSGFMEYGCNTSGTYRIEMDTPLLKTTGPAAVGGIAILIDNTVATGSYRTQTIISNGTEYQLQTSYLGQIQSGSIVSPSVFGTSTKIKTSVSENFFSPDINGTSTGIKFTITKI